MSAKPTDEAFQRHPRPQLPTKATLLVESRKIQKKLKLPSSHEHIKAPTLHHGTPWESMNRLGDMIQGNRRWHVSQSKGKLTMLRKMDLNPGREYLKKVKLLAHHNIAKLEDIFEDESFLYFRFEYSRFTLEEVLNVHIHLKEPHILVIACSVGTYSPFADALLMIDVDLLCNKAHRYSWNYTQHYLTCNDPNLWE